MSRSILSKVVLIAAAASVAATLLSATHASAHPLSKDKFITLGTSSKKGVYYPVGKGICDIINAGREHHLLRCATYTTGGSVYNIQAVATGDLDLALTRSGLAYQAYNGTGIFEPFGSNSKLRLISVLYSMPVSVIVKNKLDISNLEQVTGKRINIGNLGSGKRTIADLLFSVMNWGREDFSEVTEHGSTKMVESFCTGKVDVLIEAMGMPSPLLTRVADECGGKFIDLPEYAVKTITKLSPYYVAATIPGGIYKSNPNAVKTVSVDVVLITSSRLHEDTIWHVSESIFDDFPLFKGIHPALMRSTPKNMLQQKAIIPFHVGAARYYRENGLPGTAE